MKLSHLFAFAGGIVAGVAAGILFAPDSGVNTRQKITQKLITNFKNPIFS